jgi:5-methylcytosine-specific restriction endonuclease McrA
LGYTTEELIVIFNKTGGYCVRCKKQIVLDNYGKMGERGAWEVDHHYPKARGGSDYFHNLWPTCISCNRSKGALRPGEDSGMEIPLGSLRHKWLK